MIGLDGNPVYRPARTFSDGLALPTMPGTYLQMGGFLSSLDIQVTSMHVAKPAVKLTPKQRRRADKKRHRKEKRQWMIGPWNAIRAVETPPSLRGIRFTPKEELVDSAVRRALQRVWDMNPISVMAQRKSIPELSYVDAKHQFLWAPTVSRI